jgi:plastocyanin
MNGFVLRRLGWAALLPLSVIVYGCGGGGAAPPSAPVPPGTGPTPPAGSPTTPTTPTTPTQPAPTPAAPTPPSAPSAATISTPDRTFAPGAVTIAQNGTVTWEVIDDRHVIRFIGAAPPGGSPGEIEEGNSVSRTFPEAGSYDFECERHRDKGMRGTIVVQPGASAPPTTPPPTQPPPAPPAPPSGSTVTVTTPNETFSPAAVTIPVGGTVTWQFSGTRHNVTFQGTTVPPGGNVPDQEPGTSASRSFTAPGTYNYLCSRHGGMTGRVTVQ